MGRHSGALGTSPNHDSVLPAHQSKMSISLLCLTAVSLRSLLNIFPLGFHCSSLPSLPCCHTTDVPPAKHIHNSSPKGPFPVCPPFVIPSSCNLEEI